mgnify:CR=1 FL=1
MNKDLQFALKRFFDILCALGGLVVLSPVLLIVSVLIKLESPGPVFFTQQRLGRCGQTFMIIKFRTMVVNAETIGTGLRVSTGDDPRITKVGKVLRSTSLDELPQLFNVLKGDMSLVGPRPPVTYHPYDGYDNYPELAKRRFQVRPGLTGLAQVTVRNSASWDERIRIDLDYIENFCLWGDIKILMRTAQRVFSRESIYT